MNEKIRTTFNNISLNYDIQRRKFIPRFDDFYNVAVSILHIKKRNPAILDIGAGTGLLSSFALKKFPAAKLTLIDISEGMLQVAKTRFKGNPDIRFLSGDYSNFAFKEKYDVIMSALSIHHLSDEEKKHLYNKCYRLLQEPGIFVNADQVCGATLLLDNLYKREWKRFIESTDLPKDEIEACYERMKLDKETTLDTQLSWLREAGFKNVDCVYKYYNFAVITGTK